MTGAKLHQISLGVALAVPKSPKPTFKEGGAGRDVILLERPLSRGSK
jgi:hypothetical protein